jgi:hypothetical protein
MIHYPHPARTFTKKPIMPAQHVLLLLEHAIPLLALQPEDERTGKQKYVCLAVRLAARKGEHNGPITLVSEETLQWTLNCIHEALRPGAFLSWLVVQGHYELVNQSWSLIPDVQAARHRWMKQMCVELQEFI